MRKNNNKITKHYFFYLFIYFTYFIHTKQFDVFLHPPQVRLIGTTSNYSKGLRCVCCACSAVLGLITGPSGNVTLTSRPEKKMRVKGLTSILKIPCNLCYLLTKLKFVFTETQVYLCILFSRNYFPVYAYLLLAVPAAKRTISK